MCTSLVLINRLRDVVGLSGSALNWFMSYLKDRSFSVSVLILLKLMSPTSVHIRAITVESKHVSTELSGITLYHITHTLMTHSFMSLCPLMMDEKSSHTEVSQLYQEFLSLI